MSTKNEMSLDEVLSSIKQMVVDEKPPVLELTNMIADDGSIVKVEKNKVTQNDMGAFLDLIQKNQEKKPEPTVSSSEIIAEESSDIFIEDLIKEASLPIIQNWLQEKLPGIVHDIVQKEIKAFFQKKH